MNPEEKFDRSIRRIIRNELPEQPSPEFTDRVMEGLGVYRLQHKKIAKPLLSGWAKISIAAGYILALGLIVIFSGKSAPVDSKYFDFLSRFSPSAFGSLIQFNGQILTFLLVIMGGGWILAGLDKIMKKVFIR